MKKLISLLLAMLMLISLALPAFAENEKYEIFEGFQYGFYGLDVKLETDHFILRAHCHTYDAVEGGGGGEWIKITPKEGNNLIITRIEAEVSSGGGNYSQVGVTAGVKRETGNVRNYTPIHVDEINRNEFAFDGGSYYACFKKIKVYYEEASGASGFTLSEGNGWIIAAVGAVVVIGVAAIVISKKKKKAE